VRLPPVWCVPNDPVNPYLLRTAISEEKKGGEKVLLFLNVSGRGGGGGGKKNNDLMRHRRFVVNREEKGGERKGETHFNLSLQKGKGEEERDVNEGLLTKVFLPED